MPGDHLGRSECRHGDQVVDARQVNPWLPRPAGRGPHLAAWRLPSRTPGALLSGWRAAKAVAARVPGCASCARNARLAVRGPGLRAPPLMSAVNTAILRYGRAVIPCQRRRHGGLGRRAHGAVMPGEPGGNRQPVRRGPKSRPAEATTGSGRRSCRRRTGLRAMTSAQPRDHCCRRHETPHGVRC
jgi:hypothetical protein